MKNKNSVKIYSIGASDEEHGPALIRNIDDYFAKRVALYAAEILRADYVGHFPYSSDRVGEIAKDWNYNYIDMRDLINNVIKDLQRDVERYRGSKNHEFSHVVIISGHGGNNFLTDESDFISSKIKMPFLYVPPLANVFVEHPEHGKIIPSHADDAEHSIALYMNLLNEEEFKRLNGICARNVSEVLRRWPAVMGFGGYVLPEFGSKRYHPLKKYCGPEMGKKLLERKSIIADYDVGRQLTEGNIKIAVGMIQKFLN